ncbi:MAG: serpin [Candidatus Hydrogenedentota bacterium]
MKCQLGVLTVVLSMLLFACMGKPAAGQNRGSQPTADPGADSKQEVVPLNEQDVIVGLNTFTLDLFRMMLAEEAPATNTIVSPYSVATALAMAYAGARGQTADEMSQTLHFSGNTPAFHQALGKVGTELTSSQEYQLLVANALWPSKQYTLLESYLTSMRNAYKTELSTLDYAGEAEASRETINTWVEEKTNDRILDLIPEGSLDAATQLVITNAIYFKGLWLTQFKEERTQDMPFHLLDGNSIDVPMMQQRGEFQYTETDWYQAVELGYQGDKIAMVILLPKDAKDLARVMSELSPDFMHAALTGLAKRNIDLLLPRFTIKAKYFMTELLSSMGMPTAFTGSADFSGMSGVRDLFISDVIHQAFIEVNEEGTEAAAATGVIMEKTAIMIPPRFQADHPFVFLIRDKESGCILFTGVLAKPEGH